ncbi:hypothetical protein AVEN_60410-1 [Araneus ventricosus]|uniref:Uncharacterized protein n=1 Tax=Araneus ventricosus TaxID=182803 RepID=A0A4Y2H2P6_ARAVE|nr:hypothetical protein AVEN_60410-1 [Araneus ventricosus]
MTMTHVHRLTHSPDNPKYNYLDKWNLSLEPSGFEVDTLPLSHRGLRRQDNKLMKVQDDQKYPRYLMILLMNPWICLGSMNYKEP